MKQYILCISSLILFGCNSPVYSMFSNVTSKPYRTRAQTPKNKPKQPVQSISPTKYSTNPKQTASAKSIQSNKEIFKEIIKDFNNKFNGRLDKNIQQQLATILQDSKPLSITPDISIKPEGSKL